MSVVTVADLPILPPTTNEEEDGTVKREIKKWRERIKKHDDATVDYVKTPRMKSSCEKDLEKERENARSNERLKNTYKDLANIYNDEKNKCYSSLKDKRQYADEMKRSYDQLHSMLMKHLDKR